MQAKNQGAPLDWSAFARGERGVGSVWNFFRTEVRFSLSTNNKGERIDVISEKKETGSHVLRKKGETKLKRAGKVPASRGQKLFFKKKKKKKKTLGGRDPTCRRARRWQDKAPGQQRHYRCKQRRGM